MVPGQRRSVLLVEDQPLVREMITSVLEANDFAVIPVSDMDEAVTELRDTPHAFDTVLSDVRLGHGRNGIELADWVREHRGEVRVVLMSALTDATYASYQFLQKPFTQRELLAALALPDPATVSG